MCSVCELFMFLYLLITCDPPMNDLWSKSCSNFTFSCFRNFFQWASNTFLCEEEKGAKYPKTAEARTQWPKILCWSSSYLSCNARKESMSCSSILLTFSAFSIFCSILSMFFESISMLNISFVRFSSKFSRSDSRVITWPFTCTIISCLPS